MLLSLAVDLSDTEIAAQEAEASWCGGSRPGRGRSTSPPRPPASKRTNASRSAWRSMPHKRGATRGRISRRARTRGSTALRSVWIGKPRIRSPGKVDPDRITPPAPCKTHEWASSSAQRYDGAARASGLRMFRSTPPCGGRLDKRTVVGNAWRVLRTLRKFCRVLEHVSDEGDGVKACRGGSIAFVVFDQPAAARGPGKGPLHHPAPRSIPPPSSAAPADAPPPTGAGHWASRARRCRRRQPRDQNPPPPPRDRIQGTPGTVPLRPACYHAARQLP